MADPFSAAKNLFGLPDSYAQVSDFFPDSGEDSDYIAQIEERPRTPARPAGGVDPRIMLAAAEAGIDPMGVVEMSKKIQSDIQSQRLIRSLGDINFNEKDANDRIARLLSKNPLGAQSQGVQHILNLKSLAAQRGKETTYDEEVGNAIKGLSTLGTSEEDINKANEIISSLSPGAALKASPLITRHQQNIATLQSKRTMEQEERKSLERAALKANLGSTSKYKDNDELRDAIAEKMLPMQQQREFMEAMQKNPELRKGFLEIRNRIRNGPSDEDKMAAVGVTDVGKMTPELWSKGYRIAMSSILDEARGIQDDMTLMGISLPSAGSQSTDAASVSGASTEVTPQPTTGNVPPIVATTPPPQSVATPATPEDPFSAIARQISAKASAKLAQEAAKKAEDEKLWEGKKLELMKEFPIDNVLKAESGHLSPTNLSLSFKEQLGDKLSEEAFVDKSGRSVKWGEVVDQLVQDPRILSISERSGTMGTTSTGKKWNVTPIAP